MSIAGRDLYDRARRTTAPSSLRMAIDVRSMALSILATSAAVGMLWWAQAVFIPILLAVLISHALEPVVGFLERHWCPRPLGVFLVLVGVLAGICSMKVDVGSPSAYTP